MLKNGVADVLFGTNAAGNAFNTISNIGVQSKNQSGVSFKDALDTTAGKSEDVKQNTGTASTGKTVVENKNVKEVTEVNNRQKKDNISEDDKLSAAKEIVDEAKEIVEEVKKKFGVTDEDIQEAMEVLMISFEDLFNQKDLQNLIMTVTGTNDSVELLTNVELYDGMKEVMDFMNDVKDEITTELNITDEVFGELINDDELFAKAMEITEAPEMVNANVTEMNNVVNEGNDSDSEKTVNDVAEKTVAENVEVVPQTESDGKAKTEVKVEVNVDDSVKSQVPVSEEAVRKIVTDTKSSENNSDSSKNHDKNNDNEMNFMSNNIQTTGENTVADIVETVESYASEVDAENIMKQITEYVKINISASQTSMEMQLHPASLGTVNMQVVSQNGQVTAHFTVQNEAVKAVLETQLLTLQESLNEAGTKVSAIEVTVANYNLERGMDNGNENSSNNSQKGSKRRNINLNSLESFDDLTDEEMVEAEMMEANGNTVNFRA